MGFPGGASGTEPAKRDMVSIPGSERSPGWAWQPTPVFLPGESHEQRSLLGYGYKTLDTTEATEHACMYFYKYSS